MQDSAFVQGTEVTSPYADKPHYCGPQDRHAPQPEQVGTVDEVDSAGWADVIYPDGYRVYLNAERCNFWRRAN